jgi:hypothetical protein
MTMGEGVNSKKQGINWARVMLRLWIIASAMWCLAIFSISLSFTKFTWFPSRTMVLVRISNGEQWVYPAEWGVRRITEDLEKRTAALDQEERDSRTAECRSIDLRRAANPPHLKEDCESLLWFMATHQHNWDHDWESQIEALPKSAWKVLAEAVPWALGPPLVVLALGASVLWALAGFRRDST